jgi:hypothetical protein
MDYCIITNSYHDLKSNLVFEATRKVLEYVPELIMLSKENTWHLLVLQNAGDTKTLVEQHVV